MKQNLCLLQNSGHSQTSTLTSGGASFVSCFDEICISFFLSFVSWPDPSASSSSVSRLNEGERRVDPKLHSTATNQMNRPGRRIGAIKSKYPIDKTHHRIAVACSCHGVSESTKNSLGGNQSASRISS